MSLSSFAPEAPHDALDQDKFFKLIAQGVALETAALQAGATLKDVLHLVKTDDRFDRQLQLCQLAAPAEPLKLMENHARLHWRAAAWLLERTDPEHYGKRPPSACTPEAFQQSLDALLAIAIEGVPSDGRVTLQERLQNAAQESFKALFPHHHPAPTGILSPKMSAAIKPTTRDQSPPALEPVALTRASRAGDTPRTSSEVTVVNSPSRILSPEMSAATNLSANEQTPPANTEIITDAELDDKIRQIFRRNRRPKRGKGQPQQNFVARNALDDKLDELAARAAFIPGRVA